MDNAFFDRPSDTKTRLDSINDEIIAMNGLILSRVDQLPKQPELVAQLIRRCEELSAELKAIQATAAATARTEDGGPESPDPSLDGSGLHA